VARDGVVVGVVVIAYMDDDDDDDGLLCGRMCLFMN
jgi:hypothetical protein